MPPADSDGLLSDIAESSDRFQAVPSIDADYQEPEQIDLVEQTKDSVENEQDTKSKAPHPLLLLLLRTIKFVMLPFCRVFFAPAAQKTFIKTTVLIVTISWIIVTSVVAYIMFYNQYIPPITHVQPIWFRYKTLQGPTALVDIHSMPLRHEQLYDVSVQLHVPTSDTNFDIGNFMIDLDLNTQNGSTILHSSRPGILRYQSQTQRIMRVFAKALPLLVGLTEESQVISIKLVDNFMELKSRSVDSISIAISDPRIQIYDAKLMILANFKGLRYYMYYHSIITALAFVFTFASIEFIFATAAWKGFGENIWHKLSQFLLDNERLVVAEDDGDDQKYQATEEDNDEDEGLSEYGGSSTSKSD
ncbi:putative adipose-regulatory protein-domain-containing protein [Parasitella parasitica]|nr:putative adipose-regulatory protein-domain-containing protein [Parasitella parasitica]